MLDEYTARNNRALRELIDTHGVDLRKLPEDVIKEFKIISNHLSNNFSAHICISCNN